MRAKLIVVSIAVCASAFAVMSRARSAEPLTIIDLRNRTAEEVLPVLRPLAGPDVSISGVDYRLLVRGSPDAIAQIREAVAVLDRAQRQLRVSVRYLTEADRANSGVRINADNGAVSVGAGSSVRTAADAAVSSVQVLEGTSASISDGASTPIVTAAWSGTRPRGGSTGAVLGYRETTSGFTVTPRVNGDRVFLDIASQQQRIAGSANAGASAQSIVTTLSGKFGEWIELGGVSESGSAASNDVAPTGGSLRVGTQSDRRTIEVKVDPID